MKNLLLKENLKEKKLNVRWYKKKTSSFQKIEEKVKEKGS